MANSIKLSGEDGLALQVTKPARSAGLVEENGEGDATYLASVRVYSFEDLLVVASRDTDHLKTEAVAELVASTTRDTASVYQAINASVHISGNGYQVQLPPAEDAGFYQGDTAPVKSLPGLLLIYCDRSQRLADDLASLRRDQLEDEMNHCQY